MLEVSLGSTIAIWYLDLITQCSLVDRHFVLDDFELRILSPQQIIDETYNFVPGIDVRSEGLVPIGACTLGTGDPYFALFSPSDAYLWQVSHEAALRDGVEHHMKWEVSSSLWEFLGTRQVS